ncbi:MAG: CBS domain-containing protein [Nanoarchaeota archaeon]
MAIENGLLKTDYISAQIGDRLGQVIGKIKNETFSEVFIFEGKQLKGIFSPISIIKSGINVSQTKVDSVIRPIKSIEYNGDILSVAKNILDTNYNTVIVHDDKSIKGIINIVDLLYHIRSSFKRILVSEIKVKKPVAVHENTSIGKAIHLIQDLKLSGLLVNDGKETLGVITPYDMIRNIHLGSFSRDAGGKHGSRSKAFKAEKNDLNQISVSNFIKYKNKISILPNMGAVDLIELLYDNQLLSVILGNASLITARDVLRHMFDSKGLFKPELSA